jgi:hypothetical protein
MSHNSGRFFDFEKAISRQTQSNQFEMFKSENGFTDQHAWRLYRDAGADERYTSYCKTNVSSQEMFKFRLLLAKQIDSEDKKILSENRTRYRTLGKQ